jgi:hypothetical protein
MKAWPLLLLGIGSQVGACADPPRRPPVAYVPIVRGPEAPQAPLGPAAGSTVPTEKEGGTATSIVAVSTEAPPSDEMCVKKNALGCCGDSGPAPKKQGAKTVCPAGTVLRTKCKQPAICSNKR